jgi:hypothetical protein
MTAHTEYSLARPGVTKILDPTLAVAAPEAIRAKRMISSQDC